MRYALALGLVAIFVTAGHYVSVVALNLEECREDAIASIDLQTRSVDRIAFLITAIDRNPEETRYLRGELARTIRQLEKAHSEVANPNPEFALSEETHASLRHIYHAGTIPFSGSVETFLRHAKAVSEALEAGDPIPRNSVETIVVTGGSSIVGTLQLIKRIVERDADDALETVERADFAIWIAALALLSLEAVFIFRPMVARVGRSVREAAESAASQAGAETASVVKTNMLRNVGHELRTPMNAIIGQSMLLKHTGLSGEQMEMVESVEDAGKLLLEQINDFLELTKLVNGDFEIRDEAVGLRETVLPLVRLVENRARSKGLGLSLSVDRNTPDRVWTDPVALQQVLTHVLSNAVKFTDHGEISVRVSVTGRETAPENKRLVFEIEDTGCGIPKGRLPHIFDAFEQADGSLTRVHGGTGLGLALSRRIVELMGGGIGVESEMGRGARFWVSLPLRELEDPVIATATAPLEQAPLAAAVA